MRVRSGARGGTRDATRLADVQRHRAGVLLLARRYLLPERATPSATRLDRIAAVAAPGTRIALDYKYPRHLVPVDGLLFADKLDQFVAKRGEPMLSMFTPDELNAELRRAGFTEIDHVSPEQQAQRYLEGRGDMTAPAPSFALALFAA